MDRIMFQRNGRKSLIWEETQRLEAVDAQEFLKLEVFISRVIT